MKQLIISITLILISTNTFSFQRVNHKRLRDYFFNSISERECKSNTKCNMFFRNIARDSKSCLVEPTLLENASHHLKREHGKLKANSVSGTIRYIGVYPGKYGYYFYIDQQDNLIIQSNVFFTNGAPKSAIEKVERAAKHVSTFWTRHNPFDFEKVKFKLSITNERKYAHITPKLLTEHTRGPYFKNWSSEWWHDTFEHEYGHVLGLDDEYNNVTMSITRNADVGREQCHYTSIMCNQAQKPLKYHYYLVLRRLFCL